MIASAAVGRERENPRSERSEPAALKGQLGEVLGGQKLLDFTSRYEGEVTRPGTHSLIAQLDRRGWAKQLLWKYLQSGFLWWPRGLYLALMF